MALNRGSSDWLTDDGQYSEEKFYCHSTDGKGHSESLRVNIPPTQMAQVQKLLQSGKFPEYGSVQDIARDALAHRLHFIASWTGSSELLRIVEFEMRNSERSRRIKMIQRMKFALQETTDLLRDCYEYGDRLNLIDALNDAKRELDATFMTEPWRSKMANVIEDYERKLDN